MISHLVWCARNTNRAHSAAFARWLRLLLERSCDAGAYDRALDRARTAVDVLKHDPSAYPADEAQWCVEPGLTVPVVF